MFGECHAHIFMNGSNYREAVNLHENHVCREKVREYFEEYQRRNVRFIRDGGDGLGVSEWARTAAGEYGITYRTPLFAIHKNHHYGGIVGKGFDDLKEYRCLVEEVRRKGGDFIKVMFSGIMDFDRPGVITGSSLEPLEIREMIHIAHEEGFAVMAHVNGKDAVFQAAKYGADSIEHGAYLDEACLQVMAEKGTVWVPTVVTIRNLMGSGRFQEESVFQIYERDVLNIKTAYAMGVQMALGSDAGAYRVPHGQGIADEYQAFQDILGAGPGLNAFLEKGERIIREKF
ncbi:MAG: amidohydrolase family protein [Candidatus Limivivens sp.]|nr:amidohydrolase family protein [Candidatus Limivivens sp.]